MRTEDVWDDDGDRVVPLRRPAGQRQPEAGRAGGSRVMQLGLGDIIALLFRELWLMIIVFAVIFGVGLMAAFSMPSSYTAGASLLMQLGKNYVYEPVAGDAARGATATIDQVVQSEVEILSSTELKRNVIAKLGYKVILPSSPELWNPKTDAARAEADAAALKVLQVGFEASTAPQNNVVRLTFKHEDAQSASLILNTLIDEYLTYRQPPERPPHSSAHNPAGIVIDHAQNPAAHLFDIVLQVDARLDVALAFTDHHDHPVHQRRQLQGYG